jgi:hypothetical protein
MVQVSWCFKLLAVFTSLDFESAGSQDKQNPAQVDSLAFFFLDPKEY